MALITDAAWSLRKPNLHRALNIPIIITTTRDSYSKYVNNLFTIIELFRDGHRRRLRKDTISKDKVKIQYSNNFTVCDWINLL